MNHCTQCDKDYVYSRTKSNSKTICASCMVGNRRKKNHDKALEYKGGKCCVCGYNKCNRALHFHHLDPSKKDFTVSQGKGKSWENIKAEIDKCVLVCSNCHIEIHDGNIVLDVEA